MDKSLKVIIFLLCIDSILGSNASLAEIPNHKDVYIKPGGRSWGSLYKQAFGDDRFGKSYALVIGVGSYQSGWTRLEAPPTDAERVRDFLINDSGFDHVVTLIDEKANQKDINQYMINFFPETIRRYRK